MTNTVTIPFLIKMVILMINLKYSICCGLDVHKNIIVVSYANMASLNPTLLKNLYSRTECLALIQFKLHKQLWYVFFSLFKYHFMCFYCWMNFIFHKKTFIKCCSIIIHRACFCSINI